MNFYYCFGEFGYSLEHVCKSEYIFHSQYSNNFSYICYCSEEDLSVLRLKFIISEIYELTIYSHGGYPTISYNNTEIPVTRNMFEAYSRLKDRI